MADERPYPWLGVANEPEFFYSDCGHLLGCSDPTVDLGAKRLELGRADFDRCIMEALRSGDHGRRSSCQQSEPVCVAIDAVAADPSDENRERAYFARLEFEAWLAEDDE